MLEAPRRLCRVAGRLQAKEARRRDPEKVRKRDRAWKANHWERILAERRTPEEREKANKRARARATRSPAVQINRRMHAGIHSSLAGNKAGRRWESLVSYTLTDLMTHLERQFVNGMTWENRSKWHIDHIVPLASFRFETAEDADFKAAWAITNLRPIWKRDNLSKGGRRVHLI